MGACASIPKAMRGEFTAAPPPEQPKEDTPIPTGVADAEELENDKSSSLKTLLIEEEATKEPERRSKAKTTVPEIEESRPEPPRVSEPVAPVAAEAEEKSTKATPYEGD